MADNCNNQPDGDGLLPAIQNAAAGPRTVSSDGTSATSHSLPDLIQADKYTRSAGALKKRPLGIRYVQLIPGGASDVDLRDWRRR